MKATSRHHRNVYGWRQFFAQLVVVFVVYSLLGFATAAIVFAHAPARWSGSIVVAAAAGLAGVAGWAVVCGRCCRPAWRAVLAGISGGVLVHPIYFLLVSIPCGGLLTLTELLQGTVFGLVVLGIITLPAGAVGALVSRACIGWYLRTPRDNAPNDR